MSAWRQRRRENPLHPGIRIDKINFQGAVGLVFVGATLFIFLVGLPQTRRFLAFAAGAGIVVAVVLHFTARDR